MTTIGARHLPMSATANCVMATGRKRRCRPLLSQAARHKLEVDALKLKHVQQVAWFWCEMQVQVNHHRMTTEDLEYQVDELEDRVEQLQTALKAAQNAHHIPSKQIKRFLLHLHVHVDSGGTERTITSSNVVAMINELLRAVS